MPRADPTTGDRPETIEETAELVTSPGGTGIAIGVDHLDPEQVRQLRGRVRDERRPGDARTHLRAAVEGFEPHAGPGNRRPAA